MSAIAIAALGCTVETPDDGNLLNPTAGTTVPTAGTTVPTAGTTAPAGGTTAPTGGTTAPTAGTTAPTAGTTALGGAGGTDGSAGMSGAGGATAGAGGGDPTAMCIADAVTMGRGGPCSECGCMKCLDKITACQDEPCASVVRCGQMMGCSGRQCFCGTKTPLDCALFGADGPCMAVIAAAAGADVCGQPADYASCALALSNTTDPMNTAMYDPENPVSRANAVSICTRGQRAAEAMPPVAAVPEIMGMCETECAQ